MKNIFDFIEKLEVYFDREKKEDTWVYSGHTYQGSLLIKNFANDKKIIIKPYDSASPTGGKKIQDFIARTLIFKGHFIDNYIIVCRNFKDIAKRLAKGNTQLSLISVNLKNKDILVYGSMHIDLNILNNIIEFASDIQFTISYDFEGLLKHQGYDKKENKAITQIEERQKNPKVFFSYSWDNEKHRRWVLKLASDLIKNGIIVLIDEWDLENYNNDLHVFMETGIKDSDKAVMICTPNYADKANKREGGVGVENTIITGEFYDKKNANKFIPIIRESEGNLTSSLPTYMKSKFALDFTDDNEYKAKQDELIRKILKVPKYKKPELGNIPELKSNEI